MNLASRIARATAIGSGHFSALQAVVIFGLFIVLLVFSVIGQIDPSIQKTGEAAGDFLLNSDFFYRLFTFLTPDTDYANSNSIPDGWKVARFIGILIPLVGLLVVLQYLIGHRVAQFTVCKFSKGHDLYFADSGAANSIARAGAKAGRLSVLVDPSFSRDDPKFRDLTDVGVVIFRRLSEAEFAVISERASRCVYWYDDDTTNLINCLSSRTKLKRKDVYARVEAPALFKAVSAAAKIDGDDHAILRPISVDSCVVRRGIPSVDLITHTKVTKRERVHVCIWGQSNVAIWAAEAILKNCWSIHLEAPKVTIVAEDCDSVWKEGILSALNEENVSIFSSNKRPQVEFVKEFSADLLETVSCHFIDLADNDASLNRLIYLDDQILKSGIEEPLLIPFLRDIGEGSTSENPLNGGGGDSRPDILENLVSSRKVERIVKTEAAMGLDDIAEKERDVIASEIHSIYVRNNRGTVEDKSREVSSGTSTADIDWDDLPETYTAASRAAADHVSVKQWDFKEASKANLLGSDILERLMEKEHDRWCMERLLAGIRKGDNREKREHPNLVSWRELGAKYRENDRRNVIHAVEELGQKQG